MKQGDKLEANFSRSQKAQGGLEKKAVDGFVKKKYMKPWCNLEVGSTELADRLDTVHNVQEGTNNAEETLRKMAPIVEIWKKCGRNWF